MEKVKRVQSKESNEKRRLALLGERNHFFGKKHSDKTKEIISKKAKERIRNGQKNPMQGKIHTKEAREKIRISTIESMKKGVNPIKGGWNKGIKHSEEHRQKIIKSLIGNKRGLGRKAPHGKRYDYKGNKMRSNWEVIYAKWLDFKGYSWKYEPKRFYYRDRGITYLPDFWVNELNSYIEIKGFMDRHPIDKERIALFVAWGNPLIFIDNIDKYKGELQN